MGYVPYTGTKDYFDEPQSGHDLILLFNYASGSLELTCIDEAELGRLGLVAPSSKLGTTYGKTLDLIKVFASATPFFTSDTTLLFGNLNSTFLSQMQGGVFTNVKSFAAAAGVTLGQDIYAGKILRVDYFPESSGRAASAVITLLLYI